MDIGQIYDKIFSKNDSNVEPQIVGFLPDVLKYKTNGTALDIGAGLGQNSIFLAKNGFHVDAIDLSFEAIQKIKERSLGLDLTAKVFDITTESIVKDYDVIICAFVLHHFTSAERKELFEKIRQRTKKGGLNIISAFVAKNAPFEKTNEEGYPIHLLSEGEIKQEYSGWDVLSFNQKQSKPLNPDKPPLVDYIETILVRKP